MDVNTNPTNFIHEAIDSDIAEKGLKKIHTRFPPEPNGYLHIGSAKAIWISAGVAQKYNGLFNLRYDDTNPVREDDEFAWVYVIDRQAFFAGVSYGRARAAVFIRAGGNEKRRIINHKSVSLIKTPRRVFAV